MKETFFSICIPSYNRPVEIRRLLDSIDTVHVDEVEIVICEDKAPKREEVRVQVQDFISKNRYKVNYIENEENCGYDKNLRNLIRAAKGHYIMFMGDDDLFMPNAFDKFFDFAKAHSNCGYILRSYRNNYADGSHEDFQYFPESCTFIPSKDTYINLFDKSVFVSGFTIRKDCALEFESDMFDSSLLYQMYLLAETCYKYPAAYCRTLLTQAVEGGTQFFGSSEVEKGLYTPGVITIENSINFMKWYIKLINFIANEHNDDSNEVILMNLSKYSYPILAIQRSKGLSEFKRYKKLLVDLGYGKSIYFYVYYYALVFFGAKICRKVIILLKHLIGHRPKL